MFEFLKSKEESLAEGVELVNAAIVCCESTGTKFGDADFRAGDVSIGTMYRKKDDGGGFKKIEPDGILWLRPEDIVTRDPRDARLDWTVYRDPRPFHVNQGDAGDCWLIAAVKAITCRRELLEHVLPINEAAARHGIYPVRLCVRGEWRTIIVDDYFPCDFKQKEIYAYSSQKQMFPGIIEKAFAKVKGVYGGIDGGFCRWALETLTGAYVDFFPLNRMDHDTLWNKLLKIKQSGFVVAATTPDEDPELNERYKEVGLVIAHTYTILDVACVAGHRLVQVGNAHNTDNYKGKWSDWPCWSKRLKESLISHGLWHPANFWMELDDLCKWFEHLHSCEPLVGWHEIRVDQMNLHNRNDKIMAITVEKACEMVIEAVIDDVDEAVMTPFRFFFNVHRAASTASTSDAQLGELVQTAFSQRGCTQSRTETAVFEPGVYFVVFHVNPYYYSFEPALCRWCVRSALPTVSVDIRPMVTNTHRTSIHMMIEKDGSVDEYPHDRLTFWTWRRSDYVLIMVDNRNERKYARIRTTITADEREWSVFGMSTDFFDDVGPMRRRVVLYLASRVFKPTPANLHITYSTTYFSLFALVPRFLESTDQDFGDTKLIA